LKQVGVTHIVNCAGELQNYHPDKFHYLRLGMRDSSHETIYGTLEPTYQYMKRIVELRPSNKILVHCYAGMSRSATIVIYFLMRHYSMSFDDAYNHVKKIRNVISPNSGYKTQLKEVDYLLKN
jgi:protein-tyrosine phosphatase